MSNSPQLMTKGICYINGNQLTKETSVSVDFDTGAKDAKSVGEGWMGVYPGAGMTTIQTENAVPAAGFQYDPTGDMEDLDVVSYVLFFGGKTLTINGFIVKGSVKHSVEGEGSLSFEFHGPFQKFV